MESGAVLNERFELEHRIGAGGMGKVFRARDRVSGEVVALKILFEERGGHAERFEREIAVLAELSHPGIVRYIGHGETPSGGHLERGGEGARCAGSVCPGSGPTAARSTRHAPSRPS